jgi:hypothetical protein
VNGGEEIQRNGARTWPEAFATPCPTCNAVLPLRGIRPDLTLMFTCPAHAYFGLASWTSEPTWLDPHVDSPWSNEALTRQSFMVAALSLFLRSAGHGDYLFLQSPILDDFVRFTIIPGGDGGVLVEVSSRQWPCPRCEMQPLERMNEEVLFGLGFGPGGREANYASESLPFDPEWLAAITETAFRKAFDEPEDYGISAIFSSPALAEAFYLTWSYR